jgi:glycoside hydrolase-like protein
MLSRRQLLRSLACTAAGALTPSPLLARPSEGVSSASNRVQIVDADFDVTPYLGRLKSAGIKTVGRYYDRAYGTGVGETCYHNQTKTLTRTELNAIERAGLSVFVVFQHCGAQCVNFDLQNPETADKGRKDAEAAVQLARELDQPAHTPIYFAIDFDPAPGSDCALPAARIWPSIEAYFNQIQEVFARTRWEVGVYGAGTTCRRLKAGGLAKYFWVSTSLGHIGTPEFFNGGDWHLFQNVVEIKRSYAPDTFDTDVVNPGQTYFGQWTTHGPALPHSAVAATEILKSRAFVKKGCVYWSSPDVKKPRVASRPVRYTTTCRLLTLEDGGYHGVSLVESDTVDGYVHQSDLVLGGLWQNMPLSDTAAKKCSAVPVALTTPRRPGLAGSTEAKLLPLR